MKVGVVTGSNGVLMRRIAAESPKPQGDFTWSTTANSIAPYAQYFEPHIPAALKEVPDTLYMNNKNLTPAHIQLVAVMVNSDALGDLPMPKNGLILQTLFTKVQ